MSGKKPMISYQALVDMLLTVMGLIIMASGAVYMRHNMMAGRVIAVFGCLMLIAGIILKGRRMDNKK